MCALLLVAQTNLLSAQTTMNIWKDGKVTTTISTADVDSVTFGVVDLGGGIYLVDGHKFVDLGLPSGLLWAETNIGAATATDKGDYFAWGETTPKEDYSWDTYKYGTSESDMTKYNSTDSLTVLENSDDAACVNWGSSCRIPNVNDYFELFDDSSTTQTWTSKTTASGDSINGCEITSVRNGNSIFLPASGATLYNKIFYPERAYYWSATQSTVYDYAAYALNISGSNDINLGVERRKYGLSVRPVADIK